ncbi:MAG: glutathione S-transferase [Pseudomonadota bacterium]
MSQPTLYVGNKKYSSWSLRPWLALKWAGIAFEERVIALGGDGYGTQQIPDVLAVSASGRVPVLHVDGVAIHDSLAICEWANERAPQAFLWPADPLVRAEARSAAAEMHAGFAALRRDLSMNIRRRMERMPDLPDDTHRDLERLFALWRTLLTRFEGPFLFGDRTIADAMFAPVVTRLRTYAVSSPPDAQAYCAAVLKDSAYQEWERAALSETWTISTAEALYR